MQKNQYCDILGRSMEDIMQRELRYKIADFIVSMNCQSKYMLKATERYLAIANEVEIDLQYDAQERDIELVAHMSLAEYEYNYTFQHFIQKIVEKEAFCLHASAVAVDGKAILFSANSGTGKSTHARLWKEFMKEHQVENLNDDKPIIRQTDEGYLAYGTPWCGKHGINANKSAIVKALVFLEQATDNKIEPISMRDAFSLIFPQVIADKGKNDHLNKILNMLDVFLRRVPVYRLYCNMSEEAVRLFYETVLEE